MAHSKYNYAYLLGGASSQFFVNAGMNMGITAKLNCGT